MILVGGYYRSGTTFAANLLAGAAQPLMEPDAVGEYEWNDAMRRSFFSTDFARPDWPALLPSMNPEGTVCKSVQGALRWGKYVQVFGDVYPGLRVVYILRHPAGVVASHIFRRFPSASSSRGCTRTCCGLSAVGGRATMTRSCSANCASWPTATEGLLS